MKWIKKSETILFIIILIFLSLLIATHWKYSVSWEAIVQTIGSMFGVLIGSFLAGRYAINSVREQVKYDKEKVNESRTESEMKYELFLKNHIAILIKSANSIGFYIKEHESGLNVYELDFINKIKVTIKEMKTILDRLYNIDPFHISLKQYEFLGEMNEILYDLESNLEAYLAVTESIDARRHSEEVYELSYKLIKHARKYF